MLVGHEQPASVEIHLVAFGEKVTLGEVLLGKLRGDQSVTMVGVLLFKICFEAFAQDPGKDVRGQAAEVVAWHVLVRSW